jgi:acetolactate synthase I/II/III large subunit
MPTVADAVCQTLKAYGTEYFFCLTGGDHALWIALDDAGIDVVLCRSEHAAVYTADGYARTSGRPGFVCTGSMAPAWPTSWPAWLTRTGRPAR